MIFIIEKLVFGQVHNSNIRLGYNTKQPSFVLHYPRVFTGNKKASPFWLEEGLAKHPLSIVVLISDAWIARMGDLWSCRYNNKNNHRKKDDKLCLCSLHKNKETGRATTTVFQPNSLPCFHRIKKNQPVPDRNGLAGFNNRRFKSVTETAG